MATGDARRAAMHRRVDAYVCMLKKSYQVDDHGLADVAGVDRGAFAKFMNDDWDAKSTEVAVMLARLTGISIPWLFAEGVAEEGAAQMANEFTNDIPHMAEELRSIMDDLNGVIYILNAMAEEGTGATHALRNQERELDGIFATLDKIADALEASII